MKKGKNKKETLSVDIVNLDEGSNASSTMLIAEGISEEVKKQITERITKLREDYLAAKNNRNKWKNPFPEPVFDNIYYAGVEWLDSLAGNIRSAFNIKKNISKEEDITNKTLCANVTIKFYYK